jgi:hypothetical protein
MKTFYCLLIFSLAISVLSIGCDSNPFIQTRTITIRDTVNIADSISGNTLVGDFAPLHKGNFWKYDVVSNYSGYEKGNVVISVSDSIDPFTWKLNIKVDLLRVKYTGSIRDSSNYYNDTTYTLTDLNGRILLDSIQAHLHYNGILPFYPFHFIKVESLSREMFNGKTTFCYNDLWEWSPKKYVAGVGLTSYYWEYKAGSGSASFKRMTLTDYFTY